MFWFNRLTFCVIAALTLKLASGFDLKCEESDETFFHYGEYRVCLVKDLVITTPNKVVTSVNGDINPSQLIGIDIKDQTMNYFPKGLGKFFPNLMFLRSRKSHLKTLHKEDFKSMSQLEWIAIYGQDIETLDSDLFEYTPKLNLVYLEKNKIKHVGDGLLRGLKDLNFAYFSDNPCINKEGKTKEEIKSLILKLEENCSSL